MMVTFEGESSPTEIVVDSGAEENVCPREWGSKFGLIPTQRKLRLRTAGGNFVEHYGQRNILVSPF